MQGNCSKRTGIGAGIRGPLGLIGAGGSLGRPADGDGPLRLRLKQ